MNDYESNDTFPIHFQQACVKTNSVATKKYYNTEHVVIEGTRLNIWVHVPPSVLTKFWKRYSYIPS